MKYASVVFDFDSTVVDCETLDLVCEISVRGREDRDAVLAEVKRITALGMEGAMPFGESLSRRIALVAPSRGAVAEVAARIVEHITPSFLVHKNFLASHPGVAIVSGGFDEIIWPVSDLLGIPRERVLCNAFVYGADDRVTGIDQSRPSAHAGGKVRAVAEARMPRPLAIIGDGWTDYEIKKDGAADIFVAYTEHARREPVVAVADAQARSFDDVLAALV
jgi:D-3-phosphoglycerate dehydrogenase